MEKPSTSMMAKVPISDSGMVTTGITTERGEPRKANTTKRDDQHGFGQRSFHLIDRAVHEHGGVVDDVAGQAGRQLLLDRRQHLPSRR